MKKEKLNLEVLKQNVLVTSLEKNELKNLQGGCFHTPPSKSGLSTHDDDLCDVL